MKKYRITTNGLKFRVEYLGTTGFLWWKKPKYHSYFYRHALEQGVKIPVEYDSLEDAKKAITMVRKLALADERGFEPVDEA